MGVVVEPDRWSGVVGQSEAVERLRAAEGRETHAWLFVGPSGSGKRAAALAFAAGVVAAGTEAEVRDRHTRLALGAQHADLVLIEPAGRTFRREDASRAIAEAHRSPTEAARKVIVAERLHSAEPEALAGLLKTVEEPPPSVVFVLTAEEIIPELVTVASRCSVVEFGPVPERMIGEVLIGEGVPEEHAATAAAASGGDLRRARLLAGDVNLAARAEAWASVPGRLDGSGSAVALAVDELRTLIDASLESVEERHREELAELEERVERYGERGSGRRALEEAHKREVRRMRTDELRLGLSILARRYRATLTGDADAVRLAGALEILAAGGEQLVFNPNEELWLQSLLIRMPIVPLGTG